MNTPAIGISLPVRELTHDLGAIRAFAQAAESNGFTHLRIPEQLIRRNSGYVHEPLMLLAYIAAVTEKIELVPSVIIAPARQSVLLAKQAAELDILNNGHLRLGIGVGNSESEYQALGQDFHSRGRRIEDQMRLMRALWTQDAVHFQGEWDEVRGTGLNPLPIQRPIPIWIGARSLPSLGIRKRIGRLADGWFVLCAPEEFDQIKEDIDEAAHGAGRDPSEIGTEASIAVVGPREAEWQSRMRGWQGKGLTHLCLRTLGAGLDANGHIAKLKHIAKFLP